MSAVSTFFYKLCEWIMRLAFVNLLWIVFTITGLLLFGFFPSTIALFTIIRKWIMGKTDIPILQTFWLTYKKEWIKSNRLGTALVGTGILIFVEYLIIFNVNEPIIQLSKYPLLLLFISYVFLLLYVFPTYVHYHVSLLQLLKNAFFIMLINPFYTIVMLLGLACINLTFSILPPLSLFFLGSANAFVIMWCCYQSFLRVEHKKERMKTYSELP